MQSHFHRHVRDGGVHVIRSRDDDSIELLFLEHDPIVVVPPRLREGLVGLGGTEIIHVTESDDVFARRIGDVALSLATATDPTDVELLVWGPGSGGGCGATSDPESHSRHAGESAVLDEGTTSGFLGHDRCFFAIQNSNESAL